MNTSFKLLAVVLSLTIFLLTNISFATVVTVQSQNLNECDPLSVPNVVDELGIGFPPDEAIDAFSNPTADIACSSSSQYQPGQVNELVTIFNGTGRDFTDLWYVADLETRITNIDGLVNDGLAFKIDTVGLNTPLVSESILLDGIFQAGESWDFIIDGYSHPALPASAIASVGAVGAGSFGDPLSSGSIIALPVPEPATCVLMALGLVATVLPRRSKC